MPPVSHNNRLGPLVEMIGQDHATWLTRSVRSSIMSAFGDTS